MPDAPQSPHAELAESLTDTWIADYRAATPGETDICEIQIGELTYVYDHVNERVIGAHGHSVETHEPRDASRMAGHPSYNHEGVPATDRGHIISHKAGGGTDINLLAQDHKLNIGGEWRSLERYAANNPGTFMAVQMHYDGASQRPSAFTFGLERDGAFESHDFHNGTEAAAYVQAAAGETAVSEALAAERTQAAPEVAQGPAR
jgi:hypothetical protein